MRGDPVEHLQEGLFALGTGQGQFAVEAEERHAGDALVTGKADAIEDGIAGIRARQPCPDVGRIQDHLAGDFGQGRSIAHIPANLLNEGLHYVTVGLVTADPLVRHQMVGNAVSFSVYETQGDPEKLARGRYARAFPGGLRPRLNWETEHK